MPVGGLKEKSMAAHRAGIKTIIIPRKNEKDLVEIPKKIQRDMKFVFVDRMDEVLPLALAAKPAKPRRSRTPKTPSTRADNQS